MINHKIFAIIMDDEIVNMIVAENIIIADMCAKNVSPEKAYSVECTDYPCSIGDYYIDGSFYFKDKVTIIPCNSLETVIENLKGSNKSLQKDLKALSDEYKDLINTISSLTKSKNIIEKALCELSMLLPIKGGEV